MKQPGFYQNKVTGNSSLAFIQRPGNYRLVHTGKMVYCPLVCYMFVHMDDNQVFSILNFS